MALAILNLEGFEHGKAAFRIDTGTNQYYQLKIGRSVQRRSGVDWVDGIFFNSPVARIADGGNLFAPPKRIAVPLARLDTGVVYAQLFSYKNPEGKSPGFSTPVEIPMGLTSVGLPFSVATSMTPQPAPAMVHNRFARRVRFLAGLTARPIRNRPRSKTCSPPFSKQPRRSSRTSSRTRTVAALRLHPGRAAGRTTPG
jgi:hypothetical protein